MVNEVPWFFPSESSSQLSTAVLTSYYIYGTELTAFEDQGKEQGPGYSR